MAVLADSIDSNGIYAMRSEADKDGNRIDLTYAKLTDIPTVPVTDVEVNGTSVVSSGVASVTVPTATSDLTNDSNFITLADVPAQVQSDWAEADSSSDAYIANKPQNLVQDASYVHTDENFTSAEKSKLAGIAAGAEVNVQADWTEADSSSDAYIANKPQNLVQDASYVHTDENFTSAEKTKLAGIAAGAEVNVQSNWAETDNTSDSYIANKPQNLVQDASYVHTDENFTSAEKTKLAGIETGAQVNVQSDWAEADSSSDAYIANKPQNLVQDASYVHTDENFTSAEKTKLSGIEAGAQVNTVTDVEVDGVSVVSQGVASITLPTVPVTDVTVNGTSVVSNGTAAVVVPAQVQSDWAESDTTDPSYIENKPDLVDIVAGPGIVVDNPDGNTLRVSMAADYEVELWANSSGSNASAGISLSESPYNFDKLSIQFFDNNGNASIQEIPMESSPTQFTLLVSHINNAGTNVYLKNGRYSLSSSTLTRAFESQITFNGSTVSTVLGTDNLKLSKVVGINRISGGN